MKTRLYMALLIIAAILQGCGRSPQTTFYTLTPATTQITAATPGKAPSVSIADVTLPALIDRPQLVLADTGTKVQLLEAHRWAEPLKNAIPRILADNLSRMTGWDRISFHPQYASGRADYRIFVDLQQFEAVRGTVALDALWTIKPSEEGGTAITRRTRKVVKIAGEGYEAMVAAYSQALSSLAEEMATALALISKKP